MAMGSLTPCTDRVGQLYKCLAREPVAHWECATDGVAAIRDGFCDREQGDAIDCMKDYVK